MDNHWTGLSWLLGPVASSGQDGVLAVCCLTHANRAREWLISSPIEIILVSFLPSRVLLFLMLPLLIIIIIIDSDKGTIVSG